MTKKRILVHSSAGRYAIVCGEGILGVAAKEIRKLGKFSRIHLVSSPNVWRAVGKKVLSGLGLKNAHATHLMNDAESAKNLFTLEKLSRSLVRAGIDRKSLLIAVGGGVVGDVAGLAASACLRGVALVQIPTTLIAQVDSSVGGKNGVNLPEGKNLVGTFYPARLVLVDSALLKPLPERQFRGGLA
jgi:3-dehydroquinate synthase